jgi:hypothetical protein
VESLKPFLSQTNWSLAEFTGIIRGVSTNEKT